MIFKLPEHTEAGDAPHVWPTYPLANIEWYTPLKPSAEPHHGMYRIQVQKRADGAPAAEIVPLSDVRQSCMLIPAFGRKQDWDHSWSSDHVLDLASSFYVNNWSSLYAYKTIW